MEDKQYNLAMAIRFLGRAIGFATALFTMIMLIGGALVEVVETSGILLAVIGVIALTGCILSFWRERLAAVLLVLAAFGLGIHLAFFTSRNQFVTWLVLGLPYLAATTLLLTARWLEGREN